MISGLFPILSNETNIELTLVVFLPYHSQNAYTMYTFILCAFSRIYLRYIIQPTNVEMIRYSKN